MTDNRTTELLPCPFCSAEPEVLSDGRRTWGLVQHNEGCLFPVYPKHEISESDFAAWNTRTTHGTLTAEQVREAVMSADRWEKPMGNTGMTNTHLIIRDDGWQAIADELNRIRK